MSTYVNHRGKLKWANVALTSGATISTLSKLAAIGAGIAIFMKPELLLSIGLTLPVALVTLGVAFTLLAVITSLAIYSISKNNEVSEMKGPKLIVSMGIDNDKDFIVLLKVTKGDYEYIKTNHQSKDKDLCSIDFELNGQRLNILCQGISSNGNYCDLGICEMTLKQKDGQDKKLISLDETKETVYDKGELSKLLGLGTGKEDKKERPISMLPSPKVEAPKAEEQAKEKGPKQS